MFQQCLRLFYGIEALVAYERNVTERYDLPSRRQITDIGNFKTLTIYNLSLPL